jgi:hypothetical protein
MQSAEELRAESRRLREAVKNILDPQLKRELAERALVLAERAEALSRSEAPEIIRANIKRYQSMLAAGISDDAHKRTVEEMLAEAQNLLANLTGRAV